MTQHALMPDTQCAHGEPRGVAYCALCRHATPTLWDEAADHRLGRTRRDDHATSIAGAASVAYRAGTQKAALLAAYQAAGAAGLTDEEAAEAAGISLRSCYWKRCGELRQDGVIAPTGQTRSGDAGVDRIVCRATSTGTP